MTDVPNPAPIPVLKPKLLTMLHGYTRATALADLLAGLSVAMVAIPLCIAIAIASGARPQDGLVTAIVAGFVISLLGGSRVQIGGPTGAFIVVVAGVVATHGYAGLVSATFLAGVILAVAGVLRLGSLARFVPEAVITGFTIGIGIIIATSQIKDVLGLSVTHEPAAFLKKIPALWAARASLSLPALATGAFTIALIVGLKRQLPRWPALIIAIAAASGLAALLPGVETLADRFGALDATLPAPRLPDLSLATLTSVAPAAFVIAFLAGIESLLSASVADRMTGGRHRPNAEILAQGVANIASSLFGGLPATGAIARTATNVRAGGKTPVAGIVHALTILIVMWLAAPLAGQMAMPALAGLLIYTAWSMMEPAHWPRLWREPVFDRLLIGLTLALTVMVDLTFAIGAGVALGLVHRFAMERSGRS